MKSADIIPLEKDMMAAMLFSHLLILFLG